MMPPCRVAGAGRKPGWSGRKRWTAWWERLWSRQFRQYR